MIERKWFRRFPVLVGLLVFLVVDAVPSEGKGRFPNVAHCLCSLYCSANCELSPTRPVVPVGERATASMVGSVIALLATFHDAGVLPPEGTAQANQLIHGLIQLQSALMKSPSIDLKDYVNAALQQGVTTPDSRSLSQSSDRGLTLGVLRSLIVYDRDHQPLWNNHRLVRAFQAYNFTEQDWRLIVQVFTQADQAFRLKGLSIHHVYAQRRSEMPGF